MAAEKIKLEVPVADAVALVNLLGQLPTSAGVFQIWGSLRDQVLAQTQADPAAPAEDIPS